MSSTRHADDNTPLCQERYMSSPEYAALRGLSGSAVAAKAALQTDPRARSLLFFLQALSLRPGGIKKVTDDFLAMFPERLGTPSMHKYGVKPGTIYNADQVKVVRGEVEGLNMTPPTELQKNRSMAQEAMMSRSNREDGITLPPRPYTGDYPLKGEFEELPGTPEFREWGYTDMTYTEAKAERAKENRERAAKAQKQPATYPAAEFVEDCRDKVWGWLDEFLVELCINPAWRIPLPGSTDDDLNVQRSNAREKFPGLDGGDFHVAELNHFRDVIGALLEFQARHAQGAREKFAETAISKRVFRTLARGLCSRKIVVVNGVEGIGKSFSAEAWCEQHSGEARFVRLEGIVNKTTFFQAVSKALGLAASVHQKSHEMQIRIRHHLEHSGIMLVVDEAHRLFPQASRIYSHPELLNWIYTLWDFRIPCALLVTPQFVTRMDAVEEQTDWRSGQFKRRVECWTDLPLKLNEADLRAVAGMRAPLYTTGMIDEMVDFALPARRQMDAIARAISAAEFIASEEGRAKPTARDLLAGIEEAQQTDLALTTKLDVDRQTKGGRARQRQRPGGQAAEPPPDIRRLSAADSTEPGEDTLADMGAGRRGLTPLRPATVPA